MTPVRALKTTNRQWHTLPPEVSREIRGYRFAHPTARMINELRFTRLSEGEGGPNWPAMLRVETVSPNVSWLHTAFLQTHFYTGYAEEGDHHQIVSDRASGITLGHVR